MATIVLLVAHYYTTIVPQLWHYVATQMPLSVLYIYIPLQGHNIGTILQLDGSYGAITWPLIKYYQFTIYPHKM